MRVPVLTAAAGSAWEAGLVRAWENSDHGVTVVRRCGGLAELLSVAAAGTGRAVLLSADLRQLDRDALARLHSAGVAAVGLVAPGDGHAEERLRRIGVDRVIDLDAGVAEIARVVIEAVADAVAADDSWFGDPAAALPRSTPPVRVPPPPRGRGQVLAVWGPTGAPGRTTVAIGVADEAARLGVSTLLVDADAYGGTVAQTLALVEDPSGVALACRSAADGQLDTARLAALSRQLRPGLRVLTGVARADRWPELRPAALVGVLEQARHLSALTVVDCGFCLERDEELSYDTVAPRRNGAALAVLKGADTVLCVGSADPVGLRRLIGALDELREVAPAVVPLVVVNRVRATVLPGEPEREVATALTRWAGITPTAYLPAAPAVLDLAMRTGATLAEAAPVSPLRQAVAGLTRELTGGAPAPRPRRRWAFSRR